MNVTNTDDAVWVISNYVGSLRVQQPKYAKCKSDNLQQY
jgi:hypothetical protein